MNFLGHIFLTPDDDELLLGNFIADSVKGAPENKYPKRVAQGIRFHRAIDEFTDNHQIVKQGVKRFRASQGKYAPVVIDVIYDHVLASNWANFHPERLDVFVDEVYEKLSVHNHHFPQRVIQFFPFMKQQNWLYNYQFEWGLRKSLEGLDRRTSIETKMHLALDVFKENSDAFTAEFEQFIQDAQKMVERYSFD